MHHEAPETIPAPARTSAARRRERWATLPWLSGVPVGVLGLALFLYLLMDTQRFLNVYDEGYSVFGAVRVLQGQMPYRDFWLVYPPGQFYLLAGLFTLFGPSIGVERVTDVVIRFALAGVAAALVGRMVGGRAALPAWIVLIVALMPREFYYGYPVFPALLGLLLSIHSQLTYALRRQRRWVVLAGLSVGAATLFRHDFGAYGAVAGGVTLLLMAGMQAGGIRGLVSRVLPLWAGFAGGIALVVGPVVAWLLASVPWSALWFDFIVFPLTVQPVTRLPYPPLLPLLPAPFTIQDWLTFYFPVLTSVGAGALLLASRRQGQSQPARWWGGMALIPLTLLLMLQALSRNHETHRLPAYIPAIILLGALAPELGRVARTRLLRGALLAVMTLITLYYVGLPVIYEFRLAATWANPTCASSLARSGCIYVQPDEWQAVRYIQQHTAANEAIYTGLGRHDRVHVNDIMFLFLAERPSATGYHDLTTGVVTTFPVQQIIVDDLTRADVRYLMLWLGSDRMQEPNDSNLSSGVVLLDDFIQQHYQVVAQFGEYQVWQRK